MPYFFNLMLAIGIMLIIAPAQALVTFTFKEALTQAYFNNPLLQAEMDRAQAMKGIFVQSGLYPNPQMTFLAENLGGSGAYSGYETAETTLAINQPIPLGRRLHYLKKATQADYFTSLARIKTQRASLYQQVGNAYIDSLYASQWHGVTKRLIKLNQDIVDAIERRVAAGAGSQLDLRLAQIRLGEAKIRENKAAREALIQRAQLARLLNNGLIINKPLADQGLSHHLPSWLMVSKAIPKSPQLKQKQLQLTAKKATIVAVKKAVWPDLNLQLGGRHFSDDGSNAAVMAANAALPVSDRNQGRIMTAEAEYTQSIHDLMATRIQLRQQLYSLRLEAEQSHYEAQLVTKSLLPLAKKSLDLAKEGYQMGRYTYIELANALNALIEEERHYQQAHADYHKALIQIAGILGWIDPKEHA